MNLDDIWDCIDDSNLLTDIDERRTALENAIRNLQQLIHSGDVSAWYPLGYAYYCHPDRKPGSFEASETVRALSTAIQQDVSTSRAHLYLAYHYFDFKDFKRAKDHVDSVNEDEFNETLTIYIRELKLCILISLNGIENSLVAIHDFAAYIASLTKPAIPPINLMRVLESELVAMSLTESIRQALRSLDNAFPILGKDGFTCLVDSTEHDNDHEKAEWRYD